MMTFKVLFAFLLGCVLFGCKSTTAPKTATRLAPGELNTLVAAQNQRLSDYVKAGNYTAIADLYTTNAVYLEPGKDFQSGREKIREIWKSAIESGIVDVQLSTVTVNGNREVIYETGRGKTLIKLPKGDTLTYAYKYVSVWALQQDNTYKLDVDMFNDVMPPKRIRN